MKSSKQEDRMTMTDVDHLSSSAAAVKHRRILRTVSVSPQFQQSSSSSDAAVDTSTSLRPSWYFNSKKSSMMHSFNKEKQGQQRRRPWYSYWCRRGGGGSGRVILLVRLALLSSPLCLIYAIRYCCHHHEGLYRFAQHNHQNGHYIANSDYPRMVAWTSNNGGGFSAVSLCWPKNNNTISTAASDLQSRLVRHRRVVDPMSDPDVQRLISSHSAADLEGARMPEFETDECKAQWAWQKQSIPTCNPIHEVDMTNPILLQQQQQQQQHEDDNDNHPSFNDSDNPNEVLRLVANGFWRDVWIVVQGTMTNNGFVLQQQEDASSSSSQLKDDANKFVLKTIRYQHPFIPRNFDRHRRDAMAMERLTSSPYIVNIYAFCGNSGAFEYADGGDITTALWPLVRVHSNHIAKRVPANLTSIERFHIGVQAAMGVAAMHNVDQEGRASIAHTDISPTQFVKVNNRYKLNDFNRARFLTWNTTSQKLCSYQIQQNPGKNRSPEEYNYEPQTEKVDVFSLGNIYFMLLMLELPFQELSAKDAAEKIKTGERPSFYADVWDSPDPYIQALKSAMIMCHQHNVTERATARQVATFLQDKLREIGP